MDAFTTIIAITNVILGICGVVYLLKSLTKMVAYVAKIVRALDLDDVDNIITEQLDKSDNQVECQTLRWVLDKISELIK